VDEAVRRPEYLLMRLLDPATLLTRVLMRSRGPVSSSDLSLTARGGTMPRRTLALTIAVSAVSAAIVAASVWRPASAMAVVDQELCPDVSALEYPANTRGAIPAAKEALGTRGRVLEVGRVPGSTYATAVKRACGVEVLRDSVYVVVHPVGMTCSACNLHAYLVKFREGEWKVWTAY
jgi:hypothetical protein